MIACGVQRRVLLRRNTIAAGSVPVGRGEHGYQGSLEGPGRYQALILGGQVSSFTKDQRRQDRLGVTFQCTHPTVVAVVAYCSDRGRERRTGPPTRNLVEPTDVVLDLRKIEADGA